MMFTSLEHFSPFSFPSQTPHPPPDPSKAFYNVSICINRAQNLLYRFTRRHRQQIFYIYFPLILTDCWISIG